MLTRSDQTVTDCLDVLDDIRPLGLAHIGFKDVGVSPDVLAKLALRIKAAQLGLEAMEHHRLRGRTAFERPAGWATIEVTAAKKTSGRFPTTDAGR